MDNVIRDVLAKPRVVAVVGLSRDKKKPSYGVARYLKTHGFTIIPINPFADQVLGEKSYKSLLDMPKKLQKTVEIIDIFRPSKDVPLIANQVIQLKQLHNRSLVMWMQLGVANEQVVATARAADLTTIMNRCIMREHKRLFQKRLRGKRT